MSLVFLSWCWRLGPLLFSRCCWLVQSHCYLCLDHPCHNEVPGLPASLLHFSQHCSSPSGSFCFSPPLPLLLLLFLCTLDLDFPPLLFYQYFCPITAYAINAVASPPIPRTLFLPSLPSAASAVMQWVWDWHESSDHTDLPISELGLFPLHLVPHKLF